MTEIETKYVAWKEVSDVLASQNATSKAVMGALEGFCEEKVLRVRVPYGTTLIEEGSFQWSLLDGTGELKAAYGDAPIPLGLVTSKVLELHAPVPGQMHRNLPIYIVPRGKFFGLFETYARAGVQSKLWGTAGASTLLVIPLIGNGNTLAKFAKSHDWTYAKDLHREIKRNSKSSLAFGRFFEALLSKVGSKWYMEFVIFPRELVDKFEAHPHAYGALRQLTLDQLAIAHSRAETTLEMLEVHDRANDADALAVRQVAHGYRPGFVPVFGTSDDERLLPATQLHDLLYKPETGLLADWCDDERDEDAVHYDFFPAIFRPSLPGEECYYFLKRPYGPDVETATKVRIADLKSAIDRIKRAEAKLFTALSPEALQAKLERQLLGTGLVTTRKVRLGSSPFVEGGVIHIQRKTKKE